MDIASRYHDDLESAEAVGCDNINPEVRELRRLERANMELGYRIGMRLRTFYQPNVEAEMQLKALSDREWTARLRLQWEEQTSLRALSVALFRSATHEVSDTREWRAPHVILQTKIAKTLEQISGRYERLIESREVESALERRRLQCGPRASACDEASARDIRRWTAEAEGREAAKRKVVDDLLTQQCRGGILPPLKHPSVASLSTSMFCSDGAAVDLAASRGSAPRGSDAALREGGLSRCGSVLDSLRQELFELEREQAVEEADRRGSVVASCVFSGMQLTLSANKVLVVQGVAPASPARPLTENLVYRPATGVLRSGDWRAALPEARRADLLQDIAGLADAACLQHNIDPASADGASRAGDDSSDDDSAVGGGGGVGGGARLSGVAAAAGHGQHQALLRHALLYTSPRVLRGAGWPRPAAGPAGSASGVPVAHHAAFSLYMGTGHRFALLHAFKFLDEPLVQVLRAVNREFCALIEGSVALRRCSYIKTLMGRCGVSFYHLQKKQFDLGMPEAQSRERDAAVSEGRPPPHVTFRGLGDENITYTDHSAYTVSDDVFLTDTPITVGQWRRIAQQFPHVAHLVSDLDLELLKFNLIEPSASRPLRFVPKDSLEEATLDDCYLELPFDTAVKIAQAFAGSLPTWQQWESAVRSDGHPYPWGSEVCDVAISLESLPFSWVVDNANKGRRTHNGYIELADSMMAFQRVHRAYTLPQERGPITTTTTATATARPFSPVASPRMSAVLHPAASRSTRHVSLVIDELSLRLGDPSGLTGLRSSLGSARYSAAPRRSLLQRSLAAADQPATPSLGAGAALEVAVEWQSLGPYVSLQGFEFGSSASGCSAAQPAAAGSSASAQPDPAPCSQAGSQHHDLALKRGSRAQSEVLDVASTESIGGVSRLGKEWNVTEAPVPLLGSRGGAPVCHVRRSAVRSVSDLFSLQDVRQHCVPLPRHFLQGNHRCFSGPPAFCIAPEPALPSRADREEVLRTHILSGGGEGGGGDGEGVGGGAVATGIQVRPGRAGVSQRRQMCMSSGAMRAVAPLRCCFRLVFLPSGAPSVALCAR